MESFKTLFEASYSGNLGFVEMMKFFQKASKKEQDEMKKIVDNEDWEGYKKLIFKVLKIKLR